MDRLAKEMNTTQSALSHLLKEGANPSINKLREIADIIGMSLSELVADDGSDFVALVSEGGRCYRADSIERLAEVLGTLGYDADIRRRPE